MHDLDISLIIDDSTILLIPITSTGINESLSNLELGWITLLFSFSILKTSSIRKRSKWCYLDSRFWRLQGVETESPLDRPICPSLAVQWTVQCPSLAVLLRLKFYLRLTSESEKDLLLTLLVGLWLDCSWAKRSETAWNFSEFFSCWIGRKADLSDDTMEGWIRWPFEST